jgi:hypothetical protein
LMLTASATEEPPYFCTTMPTGFPRDEWLTRLRWQRGAGLSGVDQSTGSHPVVELMNTWWRFTSSGESPMRSVRAT